MSTTTLPLPTPMPINWQTAMDIEHYIDRHYDGVNHVLSIASPCHGRWVVTWYSKTVPETRLGVFSRRSGDGTVQCLNSIIVAPY